MNERLKEKKFHIHHSSPFSSCFDCLDACNQDGGQLVCFVDQVREPVSFDDVSLGKDE